MGIKGIYRELGPGQRVALSKLAADSFENFNRPLRIAIDIAIWQFQTQAARGGTNPAIRTLFYRLNRFLGTPIEPIFVFDGPNKPAFKRNKRSGRGDALATAQAKRLIHLFGFTTHNAPGEAEAECALLQQQGIVDVVLSEDVDTIMFGCTKMLRNWSAEGKGTTPTHVSLYDTKDMNIKELGLGREGMVLVALMSGGDYLPDGIPGCGVKVACEAAKAGFGKSICRLKASDKAGIQEWRESLIHELKANENGYFRTKHKALAIPDDFPNLEVLRYYTHPVVSPQSTVDALRQKFGEKRGLQLEPLREFTRETFGWDFRIGAIKFIRVLAPSLLVDNMLYRDNEGEHVKRISGRRLHTSTDATPELRLSFIPQDLVPIDLSKEVDEEISTSRDGLALNSDDEFDVPSAGEASKGIVVKDPSKAELSWVLEAVAKNTIPSIVGDWEAEESAKALKASQKVAAKKKTAGAKGKVKSNMPKGALDQYIQLTKPVSSETITAKPTKDDRPLTPKKSVSNKPSSPKRRLQPPSPLEPSKQTSPSGTAKPVTMTKPWTLSSLQTTPRARHPAGGHSQQQAILIESSPAGPVDPCPTSPSPRRQVISPCSQELPESVRSILSSSNPAKVRDEEFPPKGKTTEEGKRETSGLGSSQSGKLKQTSMKLFMAKSKRWKTSQPVQSSQPAQSSQPPEPKLATRQPVQETTASRDRDPFSDSESDMEPLSSLVARNTSLSPSKRRKDSPVASSANNSPVPAPARKKLLVPLANATGFIEEIEVGVDEYEERIAREDAALQRKGIRGGVARMSDVIFVDLTEDD